MESTPYDWLGKLFTWKSTMTCAWWAHVELSISLSHYNNLSHMSGFDISEVSWLTLLSQIAMRLIWRYKTLITLVLITVSCGSHNVFFCLDVHVLLHQSGCRQPTYDEWMTVKVAFEWSEWSEYWEGGFITRNICYMKRYQKIVPRTLYCIIKSTTALLSGTHCKYILF